jgi:hypothetical protein
MHGLAISIFNNNQPVYKKTFGYKRFDMIKQINKFYSVRKLFAGFARAALAE